MKYLRKLFREKLFKFSCSTYLRLLTVQCIHHLTNNVISGNLFSSNSFSISASPLSMRCSNFVTNLLEPKPHRRIIHTNHYYLVVTVSFLNQRTSIDPNFNPHPKPMYSIVVIAKYLPLSTSRLPKHFLIAVDNRFWRLV